MLIEIELVCNSTSPILDNLGLARVLCIQDHSLVVKAELDVVLKEASSFVIVADVKEVGDEDVRSPDFVVIREREEGV